MGLLLTGSMLSPTVSDDRRRPVLNSGRGSSSFSSHFRVRSQTSGVLSPIVRDEEGRSLLGPKFLTLKMLPVSAPEISNQARITRPALSMNIKITVSISFPLVFFTRLLNFECPQLVW